MADNLTLQTTVATLPSGSIAALYQVTFSGDTAFIAPTVLGTISGSEGARTFTEVGTSNPLPISDAGGSITVDGTVAATQSGTWNIGTVTAVTGITNALPAGTNNIGDVDVLTLPTLANVTTVATVTNVATIGTSVTPGTSAAHLGKAIDSVQGSTDTGVAALAVRDDTLTTLTPADGDWTVLRVNSQGALHVTGAGGGTQYVEDTAHTTGDTGTMLLAVRRDANTTLADTTGDYAPLQVDANGALKVSGSSGTTQYTEDAASAGAESLCLMGAVRQDTLSSSTTTDGDYAYAKVDANGALYVTGTAGTAVQVDDAAFTPATSKVAMIGATFDDVSPDSVNEGDGGAVRMSANRNMYVTVRDGANNERGLNIDASGQIAVTLASAQTLATVTNVATIGTSVTPGTGASNLGKAEDAAHTTGDVGVMALGVRAATPTERSAGPTDGDYEPFATNEVGAVWVSLTESANGGVSTMNASSSDGATALTSTAQAIKASAGCLIGYYIYNPNATAQFVQLYNTASGSVTVGTTNPLFMLTIPATSAANLFMPSGIQFSTAMSWAATSTAGGNGAPSTALDAVAWYK